jgi:molecular chaperone GrpE
MSKKIETEQDIQAGQDQDVEIEFLSGPAGEEKKKSQAQAAKKTAADKALKAKLKKKDEEIKKLKGDAEDLKNDFLRLAAEKDNLRKRLEREKSEYLQFALSDVLKDFLAVLDNFERALESEEREDSDSLREGIELIYKQYLDLLKKQGVEPVESEDQSFDPRIQQAFMSEESDEVDEPTVGEVFQKGYMHHDRLLRPALVKVLLPKKDQGKEEA